MSDPAVTSPVDDASHKNRLLFEQVATYMAAASIGLLLILLFLSLYPATWGELIIQRILQIKDAVVELLGTLGGYLGMSWGRGHMDKRIGQ